MGMKEAVRILGRKSVASLVISTKFSYAQFGSVVGSLLFNV